MGDIYRVRFEDHARLSQALQPFIPQSLTILGCLENASDPARLGIWSSCSIEKDPPNLFAIFISNPTQSRIFCSAEVKDGYATAEEEAFLVAFLQRSLRVARELARTEHYFGAVADSSRILVGSIHEKWTECLHQLGFGSNPCQKYLLSPDSAAIFANASRNSLLPRNARIGPLGDNDLDLVIANSHIPRKRAYLMERASRSICIRMPIQIKATAFFGDTDESAMPRVEEQPVAWCLLHADGSIGTIYVVDACKRRGLGTEVMRQLVAQQLVTSSLERPTKGWHWVDVECSNDDGLQFYGRMKGWTKGWVTIPPRLL